MRIGLCTTDFGRAMPAKVLFDTLAKMQFEVTQLGFCSAAECGFEPSAHIEIPGSVPKEAIRAIRAAARDSGVPVGAVNGTWNMAHPDRAVREEGLQRFDGFLAAVTELGCDKVTLCSGTRSLDHLWAHDPATQLPDAWADMLETMACAARLAEKHGVVMAIETEAANVIDTPARARRVMDEVGSPNLKMILDCANLFHIGEVSEAIMRPRIDEAIAAFGRDVVIAHGKDIRPSDGIDFCGAGFGIVDFPYMIERLRSVDYKGDMMLHGAASDAEMPLCRAFMEKCLRP